MSPVERLTSWMHWDGPDESLPPDLTWKRTYPVPCLARWGERWMCTRRARHTGRHAAGNGRVIVAVWSEPEGSRQPEVPTVPDWYEWAAEEATWD